MKKYIIAVTVVAMVLSLGLAVSNMAQASGSGAIWTTRGSGTCVNPQDENHYSIGDVVVLHGKDFDPGQSLDWKITGKPGGASADPDIVVASGTIVADIDGAFCFDAYTIASDDDGEYQVKAGVKGDNYRVNGEDSVVTPEGTVSGLKFNDLNVNGQLDPSDSVLSDWTITLSDGTNTVSTVTAGDGTYSFAGLADGTYDICETMQSGWVQTFPASGTSCAGSTLGYTVVISGGNVVSGNDFGNTQNGKLVVIKHVLNDNNGTKAAADFTMSVTGLNPSPASFPGDESGTTVFLNAGAYSVSELADPGYMQSLSADCLGTILAGQTKTCTVTNDDRPITRTQGFWQTHTAFTSGIFAGAPLNGTMTVGVSKVFDNLSGIGNSKLFGAYYSSIPYKSTGAKRSAVEKARMQLLQQLVSAKLNCAAFVCNAATNSMIAAADTAYAGTNTGSMLASSSLLDAYNNLGDSMPMPVSYNPGSATPALSQSYANLLFWNTP